MRLSFCKIFRTIFFFCNFKITEGHSFKITFHLSSSKLSWLKHLRSRLQFKMELPIKQKIIIVNCPSIFVSINWKSSTFILFYYFKLFIMAKLSLWSFGIRWNQKNLNIDEGAEGRYKTGYPEKIHKKNIKIKMQQNPNGPLAIFPIS